MEIKDEKRPWGSFRQFTKNELSTVKIISIAADQRLSLQYHNKRDEFWKIISGNPDITIGDKINHSEPGDEFFIPKKTNHRIASASKNAAILEISFGDFDENDIVRIEDEYGRV